MIEGLFLASYGLGSGGAVGNILFELEQMGVFAYVLPFLMIFALVFTIISNVGVLGTNKGVNVVLALAVALMSLQFNFVSYFFAEIFPRMGVLLAVIITAVILLGLFLDFKKKPTKVLIGTIVFVGFIVILIQSFEWFGTGYGFGWGGAVWFWLEQYLSTIIVIALVIGGFIAIITKGKSDEEKQKARKARKKFIEDLGSE